jgi:hypothetical protein
MTATAAEHTALARDVAGVGRIEFEESEKKRDYWLLPEGGQRRARMPSVTEILRATWPGSEGLLNWQGSIGNAEAKRVRGESTAIGKDVHAFIESYLRTGDLLGFGNFPENRKPFLKGAVKVLIAHQPEAVSDGVERLVCHPEHRYAGRLDTIAILNDSADVTLLDYKTSAGGNLYAKAHVQGAAYAMADHRCGGERVERIGVVGISGNGEFRIAWTPIEEATKVWTDVLTYYKSLQALLKVVAEKA